MLSDRQYKEKIKKILLVAKTFLENPVSNIELSKITGISSSSVQRYLNDPEIINLLGQETFDRIQELLKYNRLTARQEGGIISTTNNKPLRDSNGKFTGNIHK